MSSGHEPSSASWNPSPGDRLQQNGKHKATNTLTTQANSDQSGLTLRDASRRRFNKSVVLRPSNWYARGITWGIITITALTIAWAYVAEVDEAVPAQGKLEPRGSVKAVQAPIGGVVSKLDVAEGDVVQAGDILMQFDQSAEVTKRQSLQQIQAALQAENQFYQAQLSDRVGSTPMTTMPIPPHMLSLTRNRAALIAENQFYRALLGEPAAHLNFDQQQRLDAAQREQRSREAAAALEIQQLSHQLNQVQVQVVNNNEQLALNQKILDAITPVAQEGGLAQVQLLQQQQTVANLQSEYGRLIEEEQRLQATINQAQERLQNTIALSEDDLRSRIAQNSKQLAEIDSQLTKVTVENQKRLQEIAGELKQISLTMQYQELRAPVSGTVFDLEPTGPGFVATASEPILKIVPEEGLVARVFITNRDIGFVDVGQPVDVRIDTFPYSEFGDVKGTIKQIGSDALAPDEVYPFYRFPADVILDQQVIKIQGKTIQLQSGMSVSVNIKTRKRKVYTFLTDLFIRKVDTLRQK